jgi:hypothetical protein
MLLNLAILALLAYAAQRYTDQWPTYPDTRPSPRHRLADRPESHRSRPYSRGDLGRAYVMIDLPEPPEQAAYDPLDPRTPLAEVERRMALFALPAAIEATRAKDGNRMWSWSDDRELVAA